MEANQQLQYLSKPIGYSEATGLEVYESYTASSGFNYIMGARNMNDLIILEQVAEGTASTFLCGVLIYSKTENVLLDQISVPRYTAYTREKVVELVKKTLLTLLISSMEKSNVVIDMEFAEKHIDKMLDTCYFERSRIAIINWAKMIGIIKNEENENSYKC